MCCAICSEVEIARVACYVSTLSLPWQALQVSLVPCGSNQDGGKENVDPTPMPKHPRRPVAKKVRTVLPQPSRVSISASLLMVPAQSLPLTVGDFAMWLCVCSRR